MKEINTASTQRISPLKENNVKTSTQLAEYAIKTT